MATTDRISLTGRSCSGNKIQGRRTSGAGSTAEYRVICHTPDLTIALCVSFLFILVVILDFDEIRAMDILIQLLVGMLMLILLLSQSVLV